MLGEGTEENAGVVRLAFARTFCGLLIRYLRPTTFHDCLRDRLVDRRRTNHGRRGLRNRRRRSQDFAFHHRAIVIKVRVGITLQAKSLDGILAARTQFVVDGTLVDHGRIVVGDIGDVGRLVNDCHVALDRDARQPATLEPGARPPRFSPPWFLAYYKK